MGVWIWVQPGYRIWKVISNYQEGTIRVFNEKGEIILERRGLTKEVISIIESNFFDLVATRLSEFELDSVPQRLNETTADLDNPMYA